jgi:hypothetical protein
MSGGFVTTNARYQLATLASPAMARISPRTSADRVTLADRGKSLLKSCSCDLEIVAPPCQIPCQDRIPRVGSIENTRPPLFGGNVTLDQPYNAIEIIHQCPDC